MSSIDLNEEYTGLQASLFVLFQQKHAEILGEGNGTPLQDSCLGNPMDGGAW